MNRTQTNREEMEQNRIDTILATEEDLIPSSGFLSSVMESVREESRMPPPIPFPWKRAVPGILLASGVFAWGTVELFRTGLPAVNWISLTQTQHFAALERPLEQAGWVALALGISLLSWLLSRLLTGRSGLL